MGIILQSNNPEHVWNALRYSIALLKAGHAVTIMLFNEGVELEDIEDTEVFDLRAKLQEFKAQGGVMRACKTCLHARDKQESKVCPVGTMEDLVRLTEESDKIVTLC
ncbi:hypothetical protein A3B21_03750 [Candidatus Uhrbacteria bacterium RIFCSPLOWO2_01_FULL_47_24]|uniref:Uncharacterized protein n=1 Tax=Candidatus Uhrbacteria bacterium RIFCSPLOWO2_01_FULL_47_24 TaxID=1802401 RepID=A0A1F7URI0_9BACT|nr:MAG: hypothetical protein A2753_01475 [Candidatus Uhrbacteria bacterium RIFCSPHIGHO2_01_FULL_47_11]OGL68587.1 MAG: hypothetical protein A3D58_02350 [Candidatus Uhrbacteria bacterium RIFCSPHIGHO2_02_FULL_46_47]OGL75503.1 MAG: hypothetical protein A3F52_04225 [Candidatus Uhrbacteria bacterium RIFCSPHIGHO2_12_FULL_47_11]OGL80876.1 MAG: hypothetical protein A3B21_03750 [Candidatus Uhrbacteria bacterium RIFCSPLOWO2_01_FULL_47_24]OGL84793.1 MAG: hypothetical protein A3J03_01105 [Candidatus Uhrbact